VPIVEYTPELWGPLQDAVTRLHGVINLSHRGFVDYYYTTRASCKLYLWISEDGQVLGTVGREVMPFIYRGRRITLRIASNWYSLQRGVGGEMAKYSGRLNPGSTGAMFGGSMDTLKILHHYDWIFVPGIKIHSMNSDVIAWPGESKWKSRVRGVRRIVRGYAAGIGARLPSEAVSGLEIREEHAYAEDLLPGSSPFTFRFAPDAEYLAWRYNPSLSFVRYRLFRILARGTSVGYVILNESPEKVIVAQCDGEDSSTLAYGVLLSLAALEREQDGIRAIYVACSCPQMQAIFESVDLKAQPGQEVPFALRRDQWSFESELNPGSWLVNYDWGDNGLRSPFLDE
jgi:hypothetical protein